MNLIFTTSIFFKGLGVIWFFAFFSLYQQIDGLYLSKGISPINELAKYVIKVFGKRAFLKVPSIFLLNSNDSTLIFATLLGIFSSFMLMGGFLISINLIILWAIYLSFINLGEEFLRYQWDILLLEVSVLAFFLSLSDIPSVMGIICFQFFLFRFLFSSGYCKIRTDRNWRNFSNMKFHFETQPLPNPPSWLFHQIALRFYKPMTFLVLVFEVVIPFLFFIPGVTKILAISLSIFLQILILLSGNYCFFNLLTILLHLFFIYDPYSLYPAIGQNIFLDIIFGIFLIFNLIQFLGLFFRKFSQIRIFPSFCLINNYGLFAQMTTKRYEINLEGSVDGILWKSIPFKFKIDDPKIPGMQIAPLQPRLDWQMWFLALDPSFLSPWFNDFLKRIFQGNEGVIDLLGEYPFKERPPKFIKVSVGLYRYSTVLEKKKGKNYWVVQKLSSLVVES